MSYTHVPVVAVLNMKGGVGKTTLAGNLFRELYPKLADGSKTLLIDFDAQFNLTQLVLTKSQYGDYQKEKRTIWSAMEPDPSASAFVTSLKDDVLVPDAKPYTVVLHKFDALKQEFHLLPGDFRLTGLNLRDDVTSLKRPRKRFENLIAAAKKEFSLIVLDCNPSSSFLTRSAIEESSHLLVPVRPDKYSVQGLAMLDDYLNNIPTLSKKPEMHIIMNGVSSKISSVETEILAHPIYGPRVLAQRIPDSRVLTARADHTGFGCDRGVRGCRNMRKVLCAAADELKNKLRLK